MKASNLIAELNRLVKELGDIEVGILNHEYLHFVIASEIKVKILRHNPDHYFSDDEKLGEFFIGIE